jgi:cytidine deaminase
MKIEELKITVRSYENVKEMPDESRMLIEMAKESTENAWAPYSKFRVGAALLLENGEVITGNNQENGAFPSGLCAERVALFYASSKYPGIPVYKMALAAYANGRFVEDPVFPCGNCRQVLLEHESRVNHPIEIIMYGTKEIKVVASVKDLLPLPFLYDLRGK